MAYVYSRKKNFNNIKRKLNHRLNRKRTKTNLKKCSPRTNNSFTCFNKNALLNIIKSWNNNYYNDKISYSKYDGTSQLWSKLDKKFKKVCNEEYCWVEQKFVDKNNTDIKKSFRPKRPKKWKENKNEWLTTSDIEKVLKQYQNKYDKFVFIGPVPIDFDKEFGPGQCVINELCNINLKRLLQKGKTKIGIVFNLDPHDKPGSHWVSFFADFDKNGLYYFDSYGISEPNEVRILMERLKEQAKGLNKDMTIKVNNTRHQFKNSECGIYSINFIVKLLEGMSYDDYIRTIIKDDVMERNRTQYYI